MVYRNFSDPTTFKIGCWSIWTNGLLSALYLVLFAVALFGNVAVIIVVVRTKRLHRSPHYVIVSLATADLLMALGPIPLTGISVYCGYWPFLNSGVCTFWVGSIIFLGTASLFNLASLSVDRALACLRPILYRTTRSRTRVISLIIVSWIIPITVFFVPLIHGPISFSKADGCYGRMSLHFRVPVVLVGFGVPFVVIIISSWFIVRVIRTRECKKNSIIHGVPRIKSDTVRNTGSDSKFPKTCAFVLCVEQIRFNLRRFQLIVNFTNFQVPRFILRRHLNSFCLLRNVSTLAFVHTAQIPMLSNFIKVRFWLRLLSPSPRGALFRKQSLNWARTKSECSKRTINCLILNRYDAGRSNHAVCLTNLHGSEKGFSSKQAPIANPEVSASQ